MDNSLPTMDNLFRRHIVPSELCSQCKAPPEDILHVVWGCVEVEGVWRNLSWVRDLAHPPPGDFTNFFSRFLQVADEHRAEYFIIMASMLWNRRNSVRLNRPSQPLENITRAAGNFLQDYLKAQEPEQVTRQAPIVHHWCPPPHAKFKANFDDAVFQSNNVAGIGVVIRDLRGEIIGSPSMRIPLPPTVAEVEALACRRAVMFAKELSLHEVLFEGDSQIVINALADGGADQSIYGHIIDDILHEAAQLSFTEFIYVNRNCNRVVDALAKKPNQV